jgi:hypothetical protein
MTSAEWTYTVTLGANMPPELKDLWEDQDEWNIIG